MLSKWEIVVNHMLLGEYTHTVDEKNRISLPSKFRKEVGKKVVITHGLDNCLFLYPLKEWEKISQKLSELGMGQADTRGFNRFMLAGAVEADVDTIGRILIPDFLKDFADLKNKVVFTGVHNRVEIWNEKNWKEYKSKIEKQADMMAEKLGEIGAF
ncbi:MAG: division/cell wall cluster transcriptional repressor MraZ [Candidatus Paceibacterota bacterium]